MACKPNEVVILKAAAVQLNDDTMMLLNFMYHTADKEAKKAGDKSFYRYEGTVMKINDYKAKLDEYKSDAHAMETWTWPTKSEWWKPDYYIAYYGDKTKKMASKWYKLRLNKMMTWENFMKLAKDGIKMTAKGPKSYDTARYELNDYATDDGIKFDITSPDEMIKHCGKCFGHAVVLKRDLPKSK